MGFLKLPQTAFVLTSLTFIASGAWLRGATLSSKAAQRGDGALLAASGVIGVSTVAKFVPGAAEKGVWPLFVSFTPERVPKTGLGGGLVFGLI